MTSSTKAMHCLAGESKPDSSEERTLYESLYKAMMEKRVPAVKQRATIMI